MEAKDITLAWAYGAELSIDGNAVKATFNGDTFVVGNIGRYLTKTQRDHLRKAFSGIMRGEYPRFNLEGFIPDSIIESDYTTDVVGYREFSGKKKSVKIIRFCKLRYRDSFVFARRVTSALRGDTVDPVTCIDGVTFVPFSASQTIAAYANGCEVGVIQLSASPRSLWLRKAYVSLDNLKTILQYADNLETPK